MVVIFVPDLPEFAPLIGAARRADCEVVEPAAGYWRIRSRNELIFLRKELGLGPALWNSALMGGFQGRIQEYSRDRLHIVSEG